MGAARLGGLGGVMGAGRGGMRMRAGCGTRPLCATVSEGICEGRSRQRPGGPACPSAP